MDTCAACKQAIGPDEKPARDKKGRLFHRACAKRLMAEREAKKAAAAAAQSKPDAMAMLLEDAQPVAEMDRCSSCSTVMPAGAVVCAHCGYNALTGESKTISVKRLPTGGMAIASGAASVSSSLVLATIGACIGGAIGASVWAGLAYFFNIEIGWIAAGVGALAGFGAALGARQHAGVMSGLIACVVAVVALFGGKLAGAHLITQQFADTIRDNLAVAGREWMDDETAIMELVTDHITRREREGATFRWPDTDWDPDNLLDSYPQRVVTQYKAEFEALSYPEQSAKKAELIRENMIESMADDMALEREEAGRTLAWPDGMSYEEAFMIEDYPADIVAEASARWDGMSEEEQLSQFNSAINESLEFFDSGEAAAMFLGAGYGGTDLLWDGLWAVLAVAAAFGTGARNLAED